MAITTKVWIKNISKIIFRMILYFTLFIIPYDELKFFNPHFQKFKEAFNANGSFYNFPTHWIKDYPNFTKHLFFYLSLVEYFFALLGIVNFWIGHILTIISFIISNLFYNNLYLPQNKISLYNTKEELFLNIGVIASLLVVCFCPENPDDKMDEFFENCEKPLSDSSDDSLDEMGAKPEIKDKKDNNNKNKDVEDKNKNAQEDKSSTIKEETDNLKNKKDNVQNDEDVLKEEKNKKKLKKKVKAE